MQQEQAAPTTTTTDQSGSAWVPLDCEATMIWMIGNVACLIIGIIVFSVLTSFCAVQVKWRLMHVWWIQISNPVHNGSHYTV